jgi:hypothetical protein
VKSGIEFRSCSMITIIDLLIISLQGIYASTEESHAAGRNVKALTNQSATIRCISTEVARNEKIGRDESFDVEDGETKS